jgi:K+:H+ antiporter
MLHLFNALSFDRRLRLPALLSGVLALVLATEAFAVDPGPAGPENAAQIKAGARGLFVLYGRVGSISAEERAFVVNRRIERILHDPALNPQLIAARSMRDGTPMVALGDFRIVEVTSADAEAAAVPAETLAEQWAAILRANLTQLQPLYARQKPTISVKTLSEHHVLLLIVQVAALLLVARLCGELALRLGQPPVIGQLLAGILLGQSFLGALLPDLKALVFPVEATQSYLLEVVSWIGVLFLLLLTGLETDVVLIRQQGKPALFTSITGILFPFLLGAGVGFLVPTSLLTTPESRLVLALFLGTVLSVSSVPVIAKILLDMQLLRRNVGQLILAAALAHDTVGWVILAVVASLAASGTVEAMAVGKTVLGTVLFALFCATLGRPLVRRTLRWVNDRLRVEHALLTAVVVLMLASAAVTQLIGVHAVLGAFIIGILLRESPVINERVLHPIETVTTAIFAPIFFAAAGLHVNLGVLARPDLLLMAFLVTGAACVGKIAGCYVGARWGGTRHWDALSVGFGTNARGAMGLIVGILGFSLGILTVDMFSLIIVMAVVTTAMTPPLLRWSLQHTKPEPDEEARLRQESLKQGSFIGRIQRVLLPSRGGEDARLAACLVNAVAEHQPVEVTGLYIQANAGDGAGGQAHDGLREALTAAPARFHPLTAPPAPSVDAILAEASRGYDLVALGCGPVPGGNGPVFGRVVDGIAQGTSLPLLVVRAPRNPLLGNRSSHILVPTSGAAHSVQSAEFAVAVARATGARITASHVYERHDEALFWLGNHEEQAMAVGQDIVEQVRSLGEAYGVPVEVLLVRGDRAGPEIVRVAREQGVDLVVMGSSTRSTQRLYLGASVGVVLRGVDCAVAVLRP